MHDLCELFLLQVMLRFRLHDIFVFHNCSHVKLGNDILPCLGQEIGNNTSLTPTNPCEHPYCHRGGLCHTIRPTFLFEPDAGSLLAVKISYQNRTEFV